MTGCASPAVCVLLCSWRLSGLSTTHGVTPRNGKLSAQTVLPVSSVLFQVVVGTDPVAEEYSQAAPSYHLPLRCCCRRMSLFIVQLAFRIHLVPDEFEFCPKLPVIFSWSSMVSVTMTAMMAFLLAVSCLAAPPNPTRPDPTRPDPTRPDPTRPDPKSPRTPHHAMHLTVCAPSVGDQRGG